MAYRGVVFDLYGTLVEGWSQPQARARSEQLAAALGVAVGPFLSLVETTYTERATGVMGGRAEMLAELCRRMGKEPAPEVIARAAELRMAQFREVLWTPCPEVPAVLAELRRQGVKLGVITDCSAETPELWETLPWTAPLEVVLFSWTERKRKPDPQLYHSALKRMGLAAEDCLYVGDGGSQELSGAERVGVQAVKVARPGEAPEGHLLYDADAEWRGPVISSLEEVLPLTAARRGSDGVGSGAVGLAAQGA